MSVLKNKVKTVLLTADDLRGLQYLADTKGISLRKIMSEILHQTATKQLQCMYKKYQSNFTNEDENKNISL